jgi:hypothetical protein
MDGGRGIQKLRLGKVAKAAFPKIGDRERPPVVVIPGRGKGAVEPEKAPVRRKPGLVK